MAQRVQIILEDDLDQSPAAETVTFALDGVNYEIDLSADNAAKLRGDFALWVGHARRVGGRKVTGRKPKGTSPNEIREWAKANGLEVSSRGRIPSDVRDAYEQAND